MDMDKVKCPTCQKPAHRHGFTKAGSQRWKCRECDLSFTPDRKKPGRPPTGQPPEDPMSQGVTPDIIELLGSVQWFIDFLTESGDEIREKMDKWDLP